MGLPSLTGSKGFAVAATIATSLSLVVAMVVMPGRRAATAAETHGQHTIRIAVDLWPGYYPLILADELGYLKERGVHAQISIPEDTDRLLADFAAGEYELIGVSLADIIPLTRVDPTVSVLLFSDESAGADVVLSKEAVTGPDSIRGKRVATNLGGFGEVFLAEFFRRHGVRTQEVTLIDMEAARVPEALATGVVDIAHTWEPYVTEAVEGGASVCFTTKDTPHLVLDGMITSGRTRRLHEPELRAIQEAWFQALDYWRANPERSEQILEQRLELAPGGGSAQGIRMLTLAENRELVGRAGTPGAAFAAAEKYVSHFVRAGALTRRPALEQLIDRKLLP